MRFFIHPIFIIVGAIAVFYAATYFFLALLVAVVLHELAHAMAAKYFGAVPQSITLTPFGGAVNIEARFLTPRQRCLVLLAGPFASLLLALFFGVIVWLFPVAFGFLEYLVVANFLVGIMNIVPIFPLDGGKALALVIKPKYILLWSNMVFGLILAISLVKFNFGLIAFAVVALLQINWEYKASTYRDKLCHGSTQKIGKFTKCAVLSTTTIFAAYKMVDKKHPTEFVVTDLHNATFYESDLEKWLITQPFNTRIRDCVPD